MSVSVKAQEELISGSEIIKKVLLKNKELDDFSVKFKSKVYLNFVIIPLEGEIYFKKPDKFKLKFTNIPDILKNQQKNFRDVVPGAEKYNPKLCKFLKTYEKNSQTLILIEVRPDKKQNLKKTLLWINEKSLNPDYVILEYNDEGIIEIENEFDQEMTFSLPKNQKIKFKLVNFNCKAKIDYHNYKINQGISDEVFKYKQ